MPKPEPRKTIRRLTVRLNDIDSEFIITLCSNTSMNESEALRFCMYVTRELLLAKSINIHIKGTFIKAAIMLLSDKLKILTNRAIANGLKFDGPNKGKQGWHRCINVFQGIINVRETINKKRVNRLG